MPLDAFRKQTFSAALPPAREYRATPFGPHARAKAVLTFACPF